MDFIHPLASQNFTTHSEVFCSCRLFKQIFNSKYELALQKAEELAHQIKIDSLLIEEHMKSSENEKH